MNTLCFFYNTKTELANIMFSLNSIRVQNSTDFTSYLCRVVKPYTDKTQGGRRVNGNWCCVIDVVDKDKCDNIFEKSNAILFHQGIEKRLQSRSRWVSVADLVNMDKMPMYYSLDTKPPIEIEGNANKLEQACISLISVLNKQTNDADKVALAQSWFQFTAQKHFNCVVKTLCDCGNCIKTRTSEEEKTIDDRLKVVCDYFNSSIGEEDLDIMESHMKSELNQLP